MKRKEPLVTGEIYHIFNRSIAEYQIFSSKGEFSRMLQGIEYYQFDNLISLRHFLELNTTTKLGFKNKLTEIAVSKSRLVEIIAYCLMPTHIHLLLKQNLDNGITKFIGNLLNSYSKYFNIKHKRKGPLWQSKFNNVLIKTDEQLLHLTRYIHLNPTSSGLAKKPEDWIFSSYREYLGWDDEKPICQYKDLMDINSIAYQKFVNDRISYQKELAKIKTLLLD